MPKPIIATLAVALLAAAALTHAEDQPKLPAMPDMPKPTKEHQWLQQLVGTWETEGELTMEPGQPPVKSKGTEVARALGGFWVVGQYQSEMMGQKCDAMLTLGYDPEKKKYVGTWVDSMQHHLWKYEGELDKSGSALTLRTEGPCPMRPGKVVQFKEVLELKDKDTKVFTSSIELDPGQWVTPIKVTSHRKK